MCQMVPICHFLADLKVFSYIWCLIILICVEFKFIPHARIELNTSMHKPVVVFCTVAVVILVVVKVRIVVRGGGNSAVAEYVNHMIFTRIIT